MRFWVGVTDKNWYQQLRGGSASEVNFWQPSPKVPASFLQAGTPFLFKLHYPDNAIVGGGFFTRFSVLPARLAWEAFTLSNGVRDYDELRNRIHSYASGASVGDPQIGCNLLCEPFFFPENEWIPVPESWSKNIVRGKTYDTMTREGQALWLSVKDRLGATRINVASEAEAERYGRPFLARARLGQGTFRVLVTEAYTRRCAITGERTLPVLDAAHIKPYSGEGTHAISNGLLLRKDLHRLFDDGYITVSPDHKVVVSRRIKAEFENGREYYQYEGKTLKVLPADPRDHPSSRFLEWHNDKVFA
jgi:putative restriction endonuclease